MTRIEQLTMQIKALECGHDSLYSDRAAYAEYQALVKERDRIRNTSEAGEEIPVLSVQERAVLTIAECRAAILAMVNEAKRTDKGKLPAYIIRGSIQASRRKMHQAWVELRRAQMGVAA